MPRTAWTIPAGARRRKRRIRAELVTFRLKSGFGLDSLFRFRQGGQYADITLRGHSAYTSVLTRANRKDGERGHAPDGRPFPPGGKSRTVPERRTGPEEARLNAAGLRGRDEAAPRPFPALGPLFPLRSLPFAIPSNPPGLITRLPFCRQSPRLTANGADSCSFAPARGWAFCSAPVRPSDRLDCRTVPAEALAPGSPRPISSDMPLSVPPSAAFEAGVKPSNCWPQC